MLISVPISLDDAMIFELDPLLASTVKGGYTIFNLASYYSLPLRVPAVKDLTLFGKIENLLNRNTRKRMAFAPGR